jgi:BirA family biotin operon repressor/biotin-[acetyl-CoA-carboxylase] ligase
MAKLDYDKIAEIMASEGENPNIRIYDTIDSTNTEAKRLSQGGEILPLLVAADAQTAGRGRLGRSFYSPSGTGTYESIVINAGDNVSSMVSITSAAAVSVCRAIERTTGLDPKIKWVNDIYLNGGKVSGILAESFMTPKGIAIVVGIGINVTTENFPPEIANVASSIGESGIREKLIALTASGILAFSRKGPEAFIDEYRERSMVIGKKITYGAVGETMKEATAIAIDDTGGLIIELPDGEKKTLSTGEITIRLK